MQNTSIIDLNIDHYNLDDILGLFKITRDFDEEDLKNRKNDEFKLVLDKANKVIKQMAESEKYDVILQQVAFINPKLDVTDKVIKAMNAAK